MTAAHFSLGMKYYNCVVVVLPILIDWILQLSQVRNEIDSLSQSFWGMNAVLSQS